MKNGFVTKSLFILAIALALMIALWRVEDIVDERHLRQQEAQQNVENSQAGAQAWVGPVLHSSCTEEWQAVPAEGQDKAPQLQRREFMLTAVPTQLDVEASVAIEPRQRGLFKVNTYVTKARLQARWPHLGALLPKAKRTDSHVECSAPKLMVSLGDARGIRVAQVQVQGGALAVLSGTGHPAHRRGFHSVLPEALRNDRDAVQAEVQLELLGTGSLALAPVAETTQVHLTSNWPHPSFGGRFLPASREVKHDGFEASWRVSSLATSAAADFARGATLCSLRGEADLSSQEVSGGTAAPQPASCIETFGVSFIDPVNPYVLSDRATKYGMLFVGLTFVAVGIVEVLRRRRVHPVQYLLVGSALVIFFLLLVSLSEHLAFGLAYGLASFGCITLLTYYARHMLGSWGAGLAFGVGACALYGALYTLLQMEQTALVMGSLLLFVVLALVMVATRKLDWYALPSTLGTLQADDDTGRR
ncbi:cell envelope integrity protein CreD [Caldimonas brevitalea]|uniref:Membrane protein n=1 Tax=Caldimonas brevitalea TaxID=413882 RepID=A0A0G3BXR4_9BURK|nr:cell envelope integrity protein CreD [Caldimonas brevitalea]AKJ32186.1 membrane protein [Caldimonas brevitalea]